MTAFFGKLYKKTGTIRTQLFGTATPQGAVHVLLLSQKTAGQDMDVDLQPISDLPTFYPDQWTLKRFLTCTKVFCTDILDVMKFKSCENDDKP